MRVTRIVGGVVAALVGLLALAGGLIAAFGYIGTDNVITTSPRTIASDGVAITSPPDLFDYYGPKLHVVVEPAQPGREIFVGVGHNTDVTSYLADAPQTKLTKVSFPFTVETGNAAGKATQVSGPNGLDWWVAKVTGTGEQSLVWPMADGPYDLVIMGADGKASIDAVVTLGLEVEGAFTTALIVAIVGLVLLGLGALLLRGLRQEPVEEELVLWDGRDQWDRNEYWGTPEAGEEHRVPDDSDAFNGPPWNTMPPGPPPGPPPAGQHAASPNGPPPDGRIPVGPLLDPATGQPWQQAAQQPPNGPAPQQKPPRPAPQAPPQQAPPPQGPPPQGPPSGPPPTRPGGPVQQPPWRPAGPPPRRPEPRPEPAPEPGPRSGDDHA